MFFTGIVTNPTTFSQNLSRAHMSYIIHGYFIILVCVYFLTKRVHRIEGWVKKFSSASILLVVIVLIGIKISVTRCIKQYNICNSLPL